MNETVEDLVVPERVLGPAEFIKIGNFATMPDVAFSTERGQGADVRVHRSVNQTGVIIVAQHISRPIEPVHPKRVHWRGWVLAVGVEKFHDTAKIVRLPRRLADEVRVICGKKKISNSGVKYCGIFLSRRIVGVVGGDRKGSKAYHPQQG